MFRWGNTFRVGSLGLAALMTVLAGAPHFDCVCPDGSLKVFCFGSSSDASGCCCGACSPAAPCGPHHGDRPACCRHGGTPTHKGAAVEAPGCMKTLAPAQDLGRAPHKATAPQEAPAVGLLAHPACPAASAPALARRRGPLPSPAPPADLLTLLQRYLL
jgi:hypothetical protein